MGLSVPHEALTEMGLTVPDEANLFVVGGLSQELGSGAEEARGRVAAALPALHGARSAVPQAPLIRYRMFLPGERQR